MNLRPVTEVDAESRVLIRLDLDVPINGGVIEDNNRLVKSVSTLNILLGKGCKVVIVGHRGRPKGRDDSLTLKPVYSELMELLQNGHEISSVFVDEADNLEKVDGAVDMNNLVFLENIRFYEGEEKNDQEFVDYLGKLAEVYVNDAFGVAHRMQASVMVRTKLPTFYGISFIEEATKIGKLLENPERPLVVVLGGAKEDKLSYLPDLEKVADKILIGGKLPLLVKSPKVESQKIIWAELRQDTLDLSEADLKIFGDVLAGAKTVIWAGAMGYYEQENCRYGTEEVAKMVAEVEGYKIIAGGDTGASIISLGLKDKIDFICSGGGVMLEFLTKGKLPAWE